MIEIYTDGSGNNTTDRRGGWAYVILHEHHKFIRYGHIPPPTTNNIAEMMAAFNAMKACSKIKDKKIRIYSDSNYCVQGLKTWSDNWIKNNWMGSNGPVKNCGLWKQMKPLYDSFDDLEIFHVKGHAGNKYNELADEYAGNGTNEKIVESHAGYDVAYI